MRPIAVPPGPPGTAGRTGLAWRALVVCLGLGVLAPPFTFGPGEAHARQTVRIVGSDPSATTGTIVGMAWKADNTPLPRPRVRLRDVATGRGIATTTGDGKGEFRFDRIEPGAYAVELLSDRDRVLAIGELFGLRPNETVATVVRLSARASWFDGFFGNTAAAAIAAASSLGITAVGSSGVPASPQ